MLTLDLTNTPHWHDLAPGVRVQLRPLTTALMVATRSDPVVEAVPEDASDEERAVAFANALARRARRRRRPLRRRAPRGRYGRVRWPLADGPGDGFRSRAPDAFRRHGRASPR